MVPGGALWCRPRRGGHTSTEPVAEDPWDSEQGWVIRTAGPVMIFDAVTVSGEEGKCLHRAQAAAIRSVLEWFAAHPAEEESTEDTDEVHMRHEQERRTDDE